MTFAWPCLLSKNCVDPATKYHGHLLLSHIIARFAIHKRIVLQVSVAFFVERGIWTVGQIIYKVKISSLRMDHGLFISLYN